jgi:RNA polymerase sigma-70 factor (ECF subfamily)
MLSTWLYKIAVNECITFLNKQRTQNNISLDNTDVFPLRTASKEIRISDGDAVQMKVTRSNSYTTGETTHKSL